MEGYSSENSASDKKDGKSEKKAGKAAGLGSRTFEFANKKDAAEKIADSSSLWEKLIPKDGGEKAKREVATAEHLATESAEEAPDQRVEILSEGEKAAVIKEYAQEKTAKLEAERSDSEDPAEAAAREANIHFLKQVTADAEATPLEPVDESAAEVAPELVEAEVAEAELPESDYAPAELAPDEAVELNWNESSTETPQDDPLPQSTHPAVVPVVQNPTPGPTPNQPLPGPVGPGVFGGGLNGNAMPAGVSPNVAPSAAENYRDSNEGAYFLAGGIVGYLLGRRRGRIKTEKRLQVVTKKLEKQIKETREQVLRQETMIRQQARDSYITAHRSRETERMAARTESRVQPESMSAVGRPEVKTSNLEHQTPAERVQHMSNSEVLAIAEKIVVDGTSLRTIYEAKQITEPGLRRLTREYLQDGDIKAALRQEQQVKEMQYERDPQMRDRLAASYAGIDAAQPQAASDALASLLAQNDTPRPSMYGTGDQAVEEHNAAIHRGKRLLISAWVVLVVVLVIVVVVLAMR